jgi:hypothetical protein
MDEHESILCNLKSQKGTATAMKTPSLYNPLAKLLRIQQEIEESGGETTEELEELFFFSKENVAERAEAMVELRCEALMLQAAATTKIAREQMVIDAQQKLIDRLDKGLKSAVELTKGPMQAGTFRLSLRASAAVIITDAAKIPAEYCKPVVVPPTPEKGAPDKALLKAALDGGKFVEGAYLDKRQNLNIK